MQLEHSDFADFCGPVIMSIYCLLILIYCTSEQNVGV